jgi:hypothetical protein
MISKTKYNNQEEQQESQCDINAIEEANQWKLKEDSTNNPQPPSLQFLRC